MVCDTKTCKGMCCTFLTVSYANIKFDDDYKHFLKLRNIEIKETDSRTFIKIPCVCNKFDTETYKCKTYKNRPEWCKVNPIKETPFVNRNICSILRERLK